MTNGSIVYDNPSGDNSLVTIYPSSNIIVKLRAHDGCGWSEWADLGVSTYNCTNNNYMVFPNPTIDFVTIERTGDDKLLNNAGIWIEFWHPAKGMIRSLPLNEDKSKIDVSELNYGLYFIKIISPKRNETHYLFLGP